MQHRDSVTVADLMDRLGATPTAAAGRHRAATTTNRVSRAMAGAVAGAAVTGGVAFAFAPAASAQSAELDVQHIAEMAGIEDPVRFAQDLANQHGVGADEYEQFREYATGAGFGSLGDFDLFPALQQGAVRPTTGPVTSGFGPRWGTFHNGTDFGAPIGTPLFAAKSGTVVAAGPASGYGLWIRIRTDDGELLEYGHNDQNYVKVGQRVTAGQVIGTVGNRGYSTGPHLHFGVQDAGGRWIDPVPWLQANGVTV